MWPVASAFIVVGFTGCTIVSLSTPVMEVASDRDHWRQAQAEGTRDAHQRFLAEHPTSPLVASAELKIQNMDAAVAWREIQGLLPSSQVYESFLRKYPVSEFSARAYVAMRDTWTQELVESERAALAAAVSQGTAWALEDYIAHHPNSRNLNEARKALQPLVASTVYSSAVQKFKEIVEKNERARNDRSMEPLTRLVYFPARTTASETYVVFKQRDYNY